MHLDWIYTALSIFLLKLNMKINTRDNTTSKNLCWPNILLFKITLINFVKKKNFVFVLSITFLPPPKKASFFLEFLDSEVMWGNDFGGGQCVAFSFVNWIVFSNLVHLKEAANGSHKIIPHLHILQSVWCFVNPKKHCLI